MIKTEEKLVAKKPDTKVTSAKIRIEDFSKRIGDSAILNILYSKEINFEHLNAIKELTDFNDTIISEWLNVDVKTLRAYKKPANKFKENVKEKVLILLALIKHGIKVFGSQQAFKQWLAEDNFYFDNKKPISFLNTVTGARFVDDNLTAIEYGDNV